MAMRMLFSLAVSLYTSRIVLQQLGVDNYGIYSLVAGLTVIIAFFRSALTIAFQRYMNVELAISKGNGMQQIFSASLVCVLIMTFVFLILSETVGLWFLRKELNIPPDRMFEACVVFQMAVVNVIIELMRIPYNALIIAHEKMVFYAYNSIFEIFLKLVVALSLSVITGNKLYIYLCLLIGVSILINISYTIYCRHILPLLRFKLKTDRKQLIEIQKFAGWNILTSVSDIAYLQGSSMILNIFFGVTLNATMGISNQIKNAIFSFSGSVQAAANPQMIQTYASGEQNEFIKLFTYISKISFYCVTFVGVPILLNTEYVLSLWLTDIPPLSSIFVKLMILFCMVDSLVGPLWVSMQAMGKIKCYQIVISLGWLSCLPFTYIAYKTGFPSYSLIIIMIIINIVLLWVRILFSQKYCKISVLNYLKQIILRIIGVVCLGLLLPIVIKIFFEHDPSNDFITSTCSWILSFSLSVYFIGLTSEERGNVNSFFKNLVKRNKNY